MTVQRIALLLLTGWLVSFAEAQEKQLAEAISDLRAEVASLNESVQSLQERLATSSSDQPVSIRIETPAGTPLAGYKVQLTSNAKPAVRATGTSGKDGSVIDRPLPYGGYQLLVTGAGWSASRRIHVEYGQPLALVMRAPDPDKHATLVLKADLDRDRFAGLRFGLRSRRSGSGYSTSYTPEPRVGDADQQWLSFPTIANGISALSVQADLKVTRVLKMSNGAALRWRWGTGQRYRLYEDGRRQSFRFARNPDKRARPAPGDHACFDLLEDVDAKVVIKTYKGEPPVNVIEGIRVPAGEVEISFGRLEGTPDRRVLASLVLDTPNAALFLPVFFQKDSAWPERLFNLGDWHQLPMPRAYSTSELVAIANRYVTLEPDETREITIRSRTESP